MIRGLSYLAMIAGLLLAIANLTMTHSLASEGTYLSAITKQQELKRQEIARLQEDVMNVQSLATIEIKAQSLGLVQEIRFHQFPHREE